MVGNSWVIAGAVIVALSLLSTSNAQAELSCHDYLRGMQLEDPDVLAQATEISHGLALSEWQSVDMLNDAAIMVPHARMWTDLLLRQLVRDCRALPDDTIDAIVATHLKARLAQLVEKRRREEAAPLQTPPLPTPPLPTPRSPAAEAGAVAVSHLPSMNSKLPDQHRGQLPAHVTEANLASISCGQYVTANRDIHRSLGVHAEPAASFDIGRLLQRRASADAILKTAQIRFDATISDVAGFRHSDGNVFGYCNDHPDATLNVAVQGVLDANREWVKNGQPQQ